MRKIRLDRSQRYKAAAELARSAARLEKLGRSEVAGRLAAKAARLLREKEAA